MSNNIWYPFSLGENKVKRPTIVSAKGLELTAEDGKIYLDMISSWWVNIHGHSHPKIVEAICQQAEKMAHVTFSDCDHYPALELADILVDKLPISINKLFFSDNGSTAVEIALKMAIQFWHNIGNSSKHQIVAFKNGYHGDTFGAMSVGRSSLFYENFRDYLFPVHFLPYPDTWFNDARIAEKEQLALQEIEQYLTQNGDKIAAVILEPLIQGAGGMKISRPLFWNKVLKLFKGHDILIIFDEVMTGFGRTGSLFAAEQIKIKPDLLCLSKGISGGVLPLAVTATTERIYSAFMGNDITKNFAHGHSYTANPIASAAAIASLQIFAGEKVIEKIEIINAIHKERMMIISNKFSAIVQKCRVLGAIAAFDLRVVDEGYASNIKCKIKKMFFAQGLLMRPLGNVVYLMPPYCITDEQLHQVYDKVEQVLLLVKESEKC